MIAAIQIPVTVRKRKGYGETLIVLDDPMQKLAEGEWVICPRSVVMMQKQERLARS